jgi:hypothetical protein
LGDVVSLSAFRKPEPSVGEETVNSVTETLDSDDGSDHLPVLILRDAAFCEAFLASG